MSLFPPPVIWMGTQSPFTVAQRQELQRQKCIYRYLFAREPVPLALLMGICKSQPPNNLNPTASQSPFTVVQWQELQLQKCIYRYLFAGARVPPALLIPLWKSPSLGYYGKKIDPEPGRCRRTDGKKWRCSKDAHPDSTYCEHHMIQRRKHSRKPVDSQPQPSSSLQTGSTITTLAHQWYQGRFQFHSW